MGGLLTWTSRLLLVGAFTGMSAKLVPAQTAPSDAQIQAEVSKALDNKRFREVRTEVHDGVVVLSGKVGVYSAKGDADKKAHHQKFVKAVQNLIEVSGPPVEDAVLREKLAQKLTYDRVGYGTTAFNALTIGVRDGVVSLGGVVYGPIDRESAVNLVSNYPGVRDVIDSIQVAPTSPMDDRIRIEEARAIYGAPQLNRYALDPAKPIRITVVNGNVTLTGMVGSEGDRTVANLQANSVPGVFKVINNLQVAGSQRER